MGPFTPPTTLFSKNFLKPSLRKQRIKLETIVSVVDGNWQIKNDNYGGIYLKRVFIIIPWCAALRYSARVHFILFFQILFCCYFMAGQC